MCLERAKKIQKRYQDKTKTFEGWKVICAEFRRVLPGIEDSTLEFAGYFFAFRPHNGRQRLKFNTWYTASARKEIEYDFEGGDKYPAGFHLFETRADAERFVLEYLSCFKLVPKIVEVEFRDVVAYGEQDGLPTVVARKIRMPG